MTTAAAASPAETGRYQEISIADLFASKTNPRTHFDDAYIAELGGSIREKGLLNPILVRPRPKSGINGTFEIVAGECRYRGSKLAGLARVPAIVRDMTDDQVLEAQLEENIHRKDLTDLEESDGYHRLIASNPTKHSAETIATRIGKSVGYVWDRLKLKSLIPTARTLFEAGRFTVGHAILLSRLKPEDQERAIDPENVGRFNQVGGLWTSDHSRLALSAEDEKNAGEYDDLKPVSIRELDYWIRTHVRFDPAHAAQAQPLVFEETAAKVETAAAQPGRGRKVISITHEYRVADDARDEKERTYGSQSWHRADGQEKSKTCDHSVLGVVVAGDGYGDTLQVCVARDKCRVHFGAVIKQKETNEKRRASGKPGETAKAERSEQKWERDQRIQREQREKKEARWKVFYPALTKAVHAARTKLKAVNGPIYAHVLKAQGLPPGTKPADLPMALLVQSLSDDFRGHAWYGDEAQLVAWAKLLGVDVKALEPEKPKAEKPAAEKKPATAKKAAKK